MNKSKNLSVEEAFELFIRKMTEIQFWLKA